MSLSQRAYRGDHAISRGAQPCACYSRLDLSPSVSFPCPDSPLVLQRCGCEYDALNRMKTFATTLQQTRSVLPVRLLNRCGALWDNTRVPTKRAVADDLIETAKRRCDFDDFEGDFFEALSRLLESCQSEARLSLIGKIALKTNVLDTLCSRLQMERDRQLYPNIARQEIREPLFIVGLPRSGTTLLHNLIASDPDHR